MAGNPGGIKVAQNADPLVALLNIEIAQIFVAYDGIGDACVSQMGGAQVDPLAAKFRFCFQQRLESGGKGGDAPGGLGSDDPLRGNFHQPHVHHGLCAVLRQQLIQHRRMGGPSCGEKLLIFFLPGAQRLGVFVYCGLHGHGSLLKNNVEDSDPFLPYNIP